MLRTSIIISSNIELKTLESSSKLLFFWNVKKFCLAKNRVKCWHGQQQLKTRWRYRFLPIPSWCTRSARMPGSMRKITSSHLLLKPKESQKVHDKQEMLGNFSPFKCCWRQPYFLAVQISQRRLDYVSALQQILVSRVQWGNFKLQTRMYDKIGVSEPFDSPNFSTWVLLLWWGVPQAKWDELQITYTWTSFYPSNSRVLAFRITRQIDSLWTIRWKNERASLRS